MAQAAPDFRSSTIANLPSGFISSVLASTNGKLYAFDLQGKVYVYDPSVDTWQAQPASTGFISGMIGTGPQAKRAFEMAPGQILFVGGPLTNTMAVDRCRAKSAMLAGLAKRDAPLVKIPLTRPAGCAVLSCAHHGAYFPQAS